VGGSQNNSPEPNERRKAQLEIGKLEIEIGKLEKEIEHIARDINLQYLRPLLTFAGIMIPAMVAIVTLADDVSKSVTTTQHEEARLTSQQLSQFAATMFYIEN